MSKHILPIALRSRRLSDRIPAFVELDLDALRPYAERALAMLLLEPIDQPVAGEFAVGPVFIASSLRYSPDRENSVDERVHATYFGSAQLVVRQDGTCTLTFDVDDSDDKLCCVVAPGQFVPPLRAMWHFIPQPVDAEEAMDAPSM